MYLRRLLTTTCLRPTIQQALKAPSGSAVEVYGWIRSVRKQKRVAFAAVSDGSNPEGLQAVFSPELAKECVRYLFLKLNKPDELLFRLTNGASVKLRGTLVQSQGAGQDKELQVEAVNVLGTCDPAVRSLHLSYPNTAHCTLQKYPIQKQALTAEYLREHVHLRARVDTQQAILRLRNLTTSTLHSFFKVYP